MPRNLFERCEVVFPVRDPSVRARIHDEILPALLADTVKARLQQQDGTYLRARPFKDVPAFSCQDFFMQLAEGKVGLDAIPIPQPSGHTPRRAAKRAPRKAVAAD